MADNPRRAAIEATFDRASDSYDGPSLVQWDITAQATLDAARLLPGEQVLDVCCGTGSTAILAAAAVAPDGRVIGVDLSEKMLDVARSKQAARVLDNLQFERGDMLDLPFESARFDAVICQLGIYFAEDPTAAAAELWRLVKPGGRLVVTTFLGYPHRPATIEFAEALQIEWPDAPPQPDSPAFHIDSMRQLMRDAGTAEPEITSLEGVVPLTTPEHYWNDLLGAGARERLEQLSPDARGRVRDRVVGSLRDQNVTELSWDLMVTVARKDGAASA